MPEEGIEPSDIWPESDARSHYAISGNRNKLHKHWCLWKRTLVDFLGEKSAYPMSTLVSETGYTELFMALLHDRQTLRLHLDGALFLSYWRNIQVIYQNPFIWDFDQKHAKSDFETRNVICRRERPSVPFISECLHPVPKWRVSHFRNGRPTDQTLSVQIDVFLVYLNLSSSVRSRSLSQVCSSSCFLHQL